MTARAAAGVAAPTWRRHTPTRGRPVAATAPTNDRDAPSRRQTTDTVWAGATDGVSPRELKGLAEGACRARSPASSGSATRRRVRRVAVGFRRSTVGRGGHAQVRVFELLKSRLIALIVKYQALEEARCARDATLAGWGGKRRVGGAAAKSRVSVDDPCRQHRRRRGRSGAPRWGRSGVPRRSGRRRPPPTAVVVRTRTSRLVVSLSSGHLSLLL